MGCLGESWERERAGCLGESMGAMKQRRGGAVGNESGRVVEEEVVLVIEMGEGAYGRSSSRFRRSGAHDEKEELSWMVEQEQEGRAGTAGSVEFRLVGLGLGFW